MKTRQAIDQTLAAIMTNTIRNRRDYRGALIRRRGPRGLRHPRRRPAMWLLAGALVFVPLIALTWNGQRARAQAEAVVNLPGDAGDGICDSTCTLRDAVEWVTLSGGGTITFAPIFTSNTPIILTNVLSLQAGVVIEGYGANDVVIKAAPGVRVFDVNTWNPGDVRISGVTITGGSSVFRLGGAGAILVGGGSLTLEGVHISNNGHYFGGFDDPQGRGGGVVFNGGTGHRILNSTISGNQGADCGGIQLDVGTLTIANSTIANNSTNEFIAGSGGGLCVFGGALSLRNVTITGNRAYQGGGIEQLGGTIDIGNSILAGNSATDFNSPEVEKFGGTFTSVGNNLIGDSTDDAFNTSTPISHHPTDILEEPPLLGPLQINGGTTPTMALLAGSPALNAGDNSKAIDPFDNSPLTTDQRGFGFNRLSGNVDIGAFEVQLSTPPPPPVPDADNDGVPDANDNCQFTPNTDQADADGDGTGDACDPNLPPFVVNSTNDQGDRVCDATECTLREAIEAANTAPGADTITFDPAAFAAPDARTINLSVALPNLSSNLTIQGPGADILTVRRDTGGDYRIFTISAGQTVSISGLTISNGAAHGNNTPDDSGGGILNLGVLTLMNSTLSGNAARFCGGGICNWDSATAQVINSRVTGNYSDHSGGGIGNRGTLTVQNSTMSGNTSFFYGGGVFNRFTAASCSLTNSTVSGNSTGDSGGGIFSEGPLTLTSSTVSGNSSAGYGGGITDEGTLSVISATIANNRADTNDDGTGGGGGLYFRFSNPLLRNTIVAGNYRRATLIIGDDVDRPSGYSLDASSSLNLIGTGGSGGLTDGINSNQVGVANPGLGPLADNGGPTQTHALQTDSPAIDKGNSFGLMTDQRGSPRPGDDSGIANASGGDGSDIGAFEVPQPDTDGDEVTDARDNCPTTPNPNQADNDNDGQGDACDSDDDNDGQTDADEIACGSNPFDAASRAPDNDADNLLDCVDPDDDNDGVLDANDNCQFMPNPDQADADGDGTGDVCDPTPKPDIVSSLVVNSANDPGTGGCDATECTLREAIMAANADGGAENITFAIPGNGPHTIQLDTSLPTLSDSVNITNTSGERITVRGEGSTEPYRILRINTGQTVSISGLTITNADTSSDPFTPGAGIFNSGTLTLTDSIVSGNSAVMGGGIQNTGTLSITNSTISGNSAKRSGNFVTSGGGIYNQGTLALLNSTISGNFSALDGGGIQNDGVVALTNSTVSGNNSARFAGGIDNRATLTLNSATITNNRADADGDGEGRGGGIYFDSGSPPLLRNSVIADNYRGAGTATEDDIQIFSGHAINSASSFNLIGTGGSGGLADGVNGNLVGVASPGLGPLANNGGPTQTHGFLSGSPAIDKGGSFGSSTDQRGSTRPYDDPAITNALGGDSSDIGAFEQQPYDPVSETTPVGSSVAVQMEPVRVTFSGVSAAGITSQSSIDPATAGTLPGGYSLGPGLPAYEITTTAQYTPPITICFHVPSVDDPATFADLRILHGEGGLLVDRTILPPDSPAPDFNSRTICARVDSLSPFVVAKLQTPSGDTTAPAVTISTPLDGTTFIKGQAVAAGYSCEDENGGSGLASCTGPVANGAFIDTSTVGSHLFTVTGTDIAGNSATANSTYNVVYSFSGFLQPVENLPALNIANAGSAIPVKFSLSGNQGLAIFAAGYPASSAIPCDASEPGTVIEETVVAATSSLTYSGTTDQYSYVWKTDRSWRGKCRMLVLRFNDGTEHLAKFRFK